MKRKIFILWSRKDKALPRKRIKEGLLVREGTEAKHNDLKCTV